MDDALIFDETPDAGLQMRRLLAIMTRLRDPETGCPWDIEQTYQTIAPYTIEEAYEVADAIEREDWRALEGELGDLLLQSVYHARIGEEAGHFDFASIAKTVSDKMVARHPHIFGQESREKSASQQTEDWEKIKAAERAGAGEAGVLDGVALALPALMRAAKLQKRAARVGFDWPEIGNVLEKLQEEAAELAEARDRLGPEEIEEEMGDLLFVAANLSRWLGVEPETALRKANDKCTRRFKVIEDDFRAKGRSPAEASLEEMDAIWNKVRAADKAS
ncbi:nucleoside triphosphate pyrophosphohydrolase [Pseudoroseicyclus tamaricis]|uniref:Nucleoside triphosphate pyrophosphohydrolase n=1 Tax=Pseudoroseicyclus tamaricis TaxID=2705421 RepID=A0A6B2JQE2_9RHOB|nr:nucleoside triphosphate pyrophosphohydrolase [Pseudoroseicyclus tamaricis]NDV00907.1 nucleoside triphosphate pyrophosphohydrolase [Pseudoroseicyclus tamaricis]